MLTYTNVVESLGLALSLSLEVDDVEGASLAGALAPEGALLQVRARPRRALHPKRVLHVFFRDVLFVLRPIPRREALRRAKPIRRARALLRVHLSAKLRALHARALLGTSLWRRSLVDAVVEAQLSPAQAVHFGFHLHTIDGSSVTLSKSDSDFYSTCTEQALVLYP